MVLQLVYDSQTHFRHIIYVKHVEQTDYNLPNSVRPVGPDGFLFWSVTEYDYTKIQQMDFSQCTSNEMGSPSMQLWPPEGFLDSFPGN